MEDADKVATCLTTGFFRRTLFFLCVDVVCTLCVFHRIYFFFCVLGPSRGFVSVPSQTDPEPEPPVEVQGAAEDSGTF